MSADGLNYMAFQVHNVDNSHNSNKQEKRGGNARYVSAIDFPGAVEHVHE